MFPPHGGLKYIHIFHNYYFGLHVSDSHPLNQQGSCIGQECHVLVNCSCLRELLKMTPFIFGGDPIQWEAQRLAEPNDLQETEKFSVKHTL